MKKYFTFLVCVMMIMSMASCGSKESQNTPLQSENTESDPIENINTSTQISDAEKAMRMYESAIRNDISVFDENLGEIKLKDCRFPSSNARLEECKLLTKAILDMDCDGINEYVIKSSDNDHIILHYYNGKVYSYCFDSDDFCKLRADGAFYWNTSSESDRWEGGLNKITFNGETLNINSICSLKYSESSVINYYEADHFDYYINEKAVTSSEYSHFYHLEKDMAFTPFEPTASYPITAEQAWHSANEYWNNADCSHEGAAGTYVVYKVVLLDTPNSHTNDYRIALNAEFFSNHDIRCDYNPPEKIQTYEQLLINAFTGEIREYAETEVNG